MRPLAPSVTRWITPEQATCRAAWIDHGLIDPFGVRPAVLCVGVLLSYRDDQGGSSAADRRKVATGSRDGERHREGVVLSLGSASVVEECAVRSIRDVRRFESVGIVELDASSARGAGAVEDALQLGGDLRHQTAVDGDDAVASSPERHTASERHVTLGGLRPVLVERDRPDLRLQFQQIGGCRRCGIRTLPARLRGEDLVGEQHLVAGDPVAHRQQGTRDSEDAVDADLAIEHGPAKGRQTWGSAFSADRIPFDRDGLLRLLELRGRRGRAPRQALHELVEVVAAETSRQAFGPRERPRALGELADPFHEQRLHEPQEVARDGHGIGELGIRRGVKRGSREQRSHLAGDALPKVCERRDRAAHTSILVTPSDIGNPRSSRGNGLCTTRSNRLSGVSGEERATSGDAVSERRLAPAPTMIA